MRACLDKPLRYAIVVMEKLISCGYQNACCQPVHASRIPSCHPLFSSSCRIRIVLEIRHERFCAVHGDRIVCSTERVSLASSSRSAVVTKQAACTSERNHLFRM